jgi:hypothetical protein
MPPVLLALAAAAWFIAAARVIALVMDGSGQEPRRAEDDRTTRAAPSDAARDLGRLEWDETTGVYKPGPPQTH